MLNGEGQGLFRRFKTTPKMLGPSVVICRLARGMNNVEHFCLPINVLKIRSVF
jgi:hypothetical protein